VRREDKSHWERRTPLIPRDVEGLAKAGVRVLVQSSPNRCFTDDEFARAGAEITSSLARADVILGVKEVPLEVFERGKAYFFFSHTMKGQPYNMPMLRRMLDLECTLLDYELVKNERGVRTIAFGRHAGLAGAIDTLWMLGRRLAADGFETPLASLRQALDYENLADAIDAVEACGRALRARPLPDAIRPISIGVTGKGGKVSSGAMEVLTRLPHRIVEARDLAAAVKSADADPSILLVNYGPEDLVEPVDERAYSFEDYLAHPASYRARFGAQLPHLTAIVHGILWKEGYPRFILREDLRRLWSQPNAPKLRVITDVTCDRDGSNESLVKITNPGDPEYVYLPESGEAQAGVTGAGPTVIAVDILPAEIPYDASVHFSALLTPMIAALALGPVDPDNAELPAPLRGAFVAHRGKLVAPWADELAQPLRRYGGDR
jgi:alpha-aminoadipic semialdehyde synthase